jgi:hypothetical protein
MAEVEDPSLLHGHVLWSQPGRDGHGMLIEPGAVVAHEFLPGLWPLLAVNFGHGRLLGAARCAGWGRARRAIWALGTPLSAPVVRAWRLASSFPGPGAALRALAYAPVLVGSFTAAALGEALGYAAGAGVWPERIERYELEAPRLDSIVGLNRGSGGGGAERSRQANP